MRIRRGRTDGVRAAGGLERLEPRVLLAGDGLLGQYYNTRFFDTLVFERVDAVVDYNYGTGSPDPRIGNDNFGIRWSGQLEAPTTGTYTISTVTDDGVRLSIDGQLLIDQWNDHPPTKYSTTVNLTAGQRVGLVMEYYENGGGASAQLLWSGPGIAEQPIPTSALYSTTPPPPVVGTGTGLKAEYFDDRFLTVPALTRTDAAIDFEWGLGAPDPSMGVDTFSARWTGKLEPRFSEPTTLTLRTDDGVRVWVNGQLRIDQWNEHPPTSYSTVINATAGQKVDLVVEYFENGGGATAQMFWSSASQPFQIVPTTALYNPAPPPPPGAGTGLRAEYYNGRGFDEFAFSRTDPTVNFDFGLGSPSPLIGNDDFAIRWSGQLEPRFTETYTLRTFTDDGVRLYLDGQLVIDQWNEHPPTSYTTTFNAIAGQKVGIVMEYFENGGGALARLFWSSASQAEQIIPSTALYPPTGQLNNAPVAVGDLLTLEQDSGTASLNPLANDIDPDGDPLTVVAVTQGNNGSVATDGTLVFYTPSAGFSGTDSFGYTVSDGRGGTAFGRVSVNVTPVNRGVLALGGSAFSVDENAGSIAIPVVRTGGSDGAVNADFVVIPGTATAGLDFTAVSGVVSFADGQTLAQIVIPILDDTLVEGDETFGVSLDRVGGGAGLGAPRTATITIVDDDTPPVGNGLLGEYFDNSNLTNLVLRRNDATINFDWGTGSPAPVIGPDTFSIRWTGQLLPTVTGTHQFRTRSDDGIRLRVNNVTVIDRYIDQAPTSHTGSIALTAGQLVDVEITYYENMGGAVMQWFWTPPGQSEQVVPQAVLFSDVAVPVVPPATLGSQTVVSGLSQPTAVSFAPDGTMYIAQQDGRVRVFRDGVLRATPFVDLRPEVNNVRDRGLLGMELHPDFPNTPYVYLSYTYDPPETVGQTGLAAPDQFGNRPARVVRVTADAATGFTTAVPGSLVVLVGKNSTWANTVRPDLDSTGNFSLPPSGYDASGNPIQDYIATDSQSHTIGALAFGLDGMLYVAIGDGTSYGNVDPRTTRVQDVNNLSGKLLRVDPITGEGLTDNPFYNGDVNSNASKVFALGLRNPFRIAVHPVSGAIYVGDVGWNRWEEINVATGGENFGWPYYEGGNGVSLRQVTGYQNLPEAQQFYAAGGDQLVTAPFWAKSHAEGARAIIVGDFYTGSRYPGFENALFFLDFQRPTIQALRFNAAGTAEEVFAVNTPGNVVEMTMGIDGFLYWVDLNGNVGRLVAL
jgi:glucose/arabinose dehydrogenase